MPSGTSHFTSLGLFLCLLFCFQLHSLFCLGVLICGVIKQGDCKTEMALVLWWPAYISKPKSKVAQLNLKDDRLDFKL